MSPSKGKVFFFMQENATDLRGKLSYWNLQKLGDLTPPRDLTSTVFKGTMF